MRTLRRNKQKFLYQNFVERSAIFDEYGNETGEYELTYGTVTEAWGNISPAKGEVNVQSFGETESYDRVIVVDDLPVTKDARIWINNPDSNATHDFIVTRLAPSLNNLVIAIKSVEVLGVKKDDNDQPEPAPFD